MRVQKAQTQIRIIAGKEREKEVRENILKKRLKDRESNNGENPISTRIMASDSDQHKIIDLS